MSDRESADLIGYLLGELEYDQEREIDERLKHDPQLRRELARSRQAEVPSERLAQVAPPSGLAEKTCALVAMFTQPKATGEGPPSPVPLTWKSAPQAPARAVRMRPVTAPPVSSCAWRWTDLVLATALAIAAVLVIAPAIQYSRNEAHLVGCQDNLRDLGTRMAVFGQSRPEFAPAPVRLDSTVPVRFIAAPVAVPLNVAVPVNAVDPFAKRGLPPRAGGPFPSRADPRAARGWSRRGRAEPAAS